jgi:SAM-dependent methyltransferase
MACRICGNSQNNSALRVREMMFGFRDEFNYFECSACGCLQIAEVPDNIGRYYPSDYYSFQQAAPDSVIRRFARIRRDRYTVFGTGLVGKLLSRRYQNTTLEVLAARRPGQEARILDVGCGSGGFLRTLGDLGFKKLFGVDPYISSDIAAGPIRILKKTILDLPDSDRFDFILFNHSLEHMWNQEETLAKASRLLTPEGICIVRMPLKTETIWNLYGTDWMQIDAPRHFYVHTVASFRHLSHQAGLVLQDITFDSTERQFWGSEQYRKDIPLEAENSCGVNPKKSMFSAAQIKQFRQRASELNRIGQGDQAAFCLMPQHIEDATA